MEPQSDHPKKKKKADTMVHPLLRSNYAWDAEMARKNAMALDPEEYMAKIAEAKDTAFWKIKTKLKDMHVVPTTNQTPSNISLPSSRDTTASQETEHFPSLDTEGCLPYPSESSRSSNSSANSVHNHSFMNNHTRAKRSMSSQPVPGRAGQSDNAENRPVTPHIDPDQQGSSPRGLWGISRLLPKSRQGKSKDTQQRARTFTSDTATSTSDTATSTSSTSSTAGPIPPPHKLQEMPSYTGLDHPFNTSRSHSRRGTNSRDAGYPDTLNHLTSKFVTASAAGGTGTNTGISTGASAGANAGTQAAQPTAPSSSCSASARKLSASTNAGTSVGTSRHYSGTQTLGSTGGDTTRNSRGSEASRVSADFDSRMVTFNNPALQFPKNKATRAQLFAAELIYEDDMERIRAHALERTKSEKEQRPSKAPYTRHGYICAEEPGEDFRLVYEPPSNEEVAHYPALPKPALCGPISHRPNKYLDPLIQRMETEMNSSAKDDTAHRAYGAALQTMRSPAPDLHITHIYEDPRPAPHPPRMSSPNLVRPATNTHGLGVFPNKGGPFPPPVGSPPARPLPIPPIAPGTSRRLSLESQYFKENIPISKENDTYYAHEDDTQDGDNPLPRPFVLKIGKRASSHSGFASTDTPAYTVHRDGSHTRTRLPLRARPSQETVLSESSQDNCSDNLSTIDERSETRSVITIFRGGQPFDPSENNLGPLMERQSFESGLVDSRDIETSEICQSRTDFPKRRPHSDPSVYQDGKEPISLLHDTGVSLETGVSERALEGGASRATESALKDLRDLFDRPLPSLLLRANVEVLAAPRRRARSFSEVEGTTSQTFGAGQVNDGTFAGSRPGSISLGSISLDSISPSSIGEYVADDTPAKIRRRMQMRNHQATLLDIEHAAFGGPPHRDLQSKNRRLNLFTNIPGPPPDGPLPPDPPSKSPLRVHKDGGMPLTPKNKGIRNASDPVRPAPVEFPSLGRDVPRGLDFSNGEITKQDKNQHGLSSTSTPHIKGYHRSSRGDSTLSLISYMTRDSFGRMEPREAGYAVEPLQIKKTRTAGARNVCEQQKAQDTQNQKSEMQDIIDAINMGADEIRQARQERVGSVFDDQTEKRGSSREPSVNKKSASFRSESTRASGSIRDLFKGSFHNNQNYETLRSDDGRRVSGVPSTGKLSGKSSIKSSIGMAISPLVPPTSSGTGSTISSSDGRPSTSHSKTSGSFLNQLKTKASFDVLRRRQSFSKGTSFYGKKNAKHIREIMAGMDDPDPVIPPLPNMGRLTMTIEEEDLRLYGIQQDGSNNKASEDGGSGAQVQENHDSHRQKALEKLRGCDPDYMASVPNGETITNPFKRSQSPVLQTPSLENIKQEIRMLETNRAPTDEGGSSGVKASPSGSISAILRHEPISGRPPRGSLVSAEEAILGSRSSHPPLGFGPPKIPPRRTSKGSPPKISSLPRMKMDSGSPKEGKVDQFDATGSEVLKSKPGKPGTLKLMKRPSYGQMPTGGGRYGYTPIDITKHATANPTEALASAATVMSLAPKIGARKEVQDKSQSMASTLLIPSLTSRRTQGIASDRTSPPMRRLRNVASAGMLGGGMASTSHTHPKKKISLGKMLKTYIKEEEEED